MLKTTNKIYSTAAMTIMHFDDVTPGMIESLLHGKTDEEGMEGMLGICKAQWHSCVDMLEKIWLEQVAKNGSTHDLESRVKTGDNIMPWSLGTLTRCRSPQNFTDSAQCNALSGGDTMVESARNLASPTVEGFLYVLGSRQFIQPREKLLKSPAEHDGRYEKLERTVVHYIWATCQTCCVKSMVNTVVYVKALMAAGASSAAPSEPRQRASPKG
ncbi:uncharacterized protein PgNI_03578 [Pyricularia grisea]|uniref:Uncharacterized protein n=1 Tax=Pyricularia grisea TaxID=148305 RepID=A0A6P8BB58_PYRGI|nr:uncharacterized protein PgNI_03578 [Pyricularia grisea]TLD13065.1 hypothetical protein PgNI_03578 [Pyricularia grisea]